MNNTSQTAWNSKGVWPAAGPDSGRPTWSSVAARLVGALAVLAASVCFVSAAFAAVPTTAAVEGLLLSAGGGPAADGNYSVTFGIYAAETGGPAVWTEAGVSVSAKGGQFSQQIGATKPLSAAALNLSGAWLGMQIASDPELPRRPLGAALFALRAAVAEALECSGCVKAEALDAAVLQAYAKSSDLAAYAKTADLVAYAKVSALAGYAKTTDLAAYAKSTDLAGYAKATDLVAYVKAASLAKVAGTGDYADLKNTPVLATVATTGSYKDLADKPGIPTTGSLCGTGLFMKGYNANGSVNCVALTEGDMPADGINEVSNGLIWDQFVDKTPGTANVPIPDGLGAGKTDTLTFPDIGSAQKIWIDFTTTNSDVSKMAIELYGPGMSSPYMLYSGEKTGAGMTVKFNDTTPISSGDINADWLGKNINGVWSITVKDTLSNKGGGTDGTFNWAMNIQTLSSKKVQIKGNLLVDGTIEFNSNAAKLNAPYGLTTPVSIQDILDNTWCPNNTSGEKSMALGGVCTPGGAGGKTWINAVDFCHAKKGYVCSGSQSLVLRHHGLLPSYTANQYGSANWIASYSDNDSRWHDEAVGDCADDMGAGNAISVACCYNWTPPRATDLQVKVGANDVGIRVVAIHNVADASFNYAATYCASRFADICDKSQLVYLRTAGKITATPYWANDGEDTDGAVEYGTANTGTLPNDDKFINGHAFACCAGQRPSTACPAGYTDSGGVCYNKVNNAGANWVTAAKDCNALGSSVCTVSQSSQLRRAGVLTHAGNWTAGFSDCDGQCAGNNGLGNAPNGLNPASSYGYACCL